MLKAAPLQKAAVPVSQFLSVIDICSIDDAACLNHCMLYYTYKIVPGYGLESGERFVYRAKFATLKRATADLKTKEAIKHARKTYKDGRFNEVDCINESSVVYSADFAHAFD